MVASVLVTGTGCTAATIAIRPAAVAAVDDSIFHAKVRLAKAHGVDKLPIGEAVAACGRLFLGAPYVGGTLDRDSVNEQLVVDLREFDCVTFYENSLALARTLKLYANPTLEEYQGQLTLLRYRDGIRNGFPSRLHYSTDYFQNGAQKGVLKPMTLEVGSSAATLDTRSLDFMSAHRDAYKQLRSSNQNYIAIRTMEESIASRGGYSYIPKQQIRSVESRIQTGDIIGITTNIRGLDCSHTGIAVRADDGRIHFLHASSLRHEVILSDEPLDDYLGHSNSQTGIVVNRPLEPTSK